MMNLLKGLWKEEEGQGMAEYALVLGVIAIGVVAVLILFGNAIIDKFNEVIGKFSSTSTGTPE
ncbi:Flp family type IVb pilin [Paenisporosarcina cavernae]|uniref:Flp family type IVb pilin n=1 Tax=Paenisporosarcina cavernae TaxID=2320858 RepID=A0A385YSI7_9BACL|nr:Flp family type IVb pilin [Paenisporosarcina cavernae]AYC28638.1 Flp family type IVb pilin [Paenisporosarcina cavernae]